MATGDWYYLKARTFSTHEPLFGYEQGAGPIIAWENGTMVTYATAEGLVHIGDPNGSVVVQWINRRVRPTVLGNDGQRLEGIVQEVFIHQPGVSDTIGVLVRTDAGVFYTVNDAPNELAFVPNQ